MADEAAIEAVKCYPTGLHAFGIHANKAVLFGSFAQGQANEWIDIDLVVIVPEFDDSREISLVKALWRAIVADDRIEPIPCGEWEWETEYGRPILDIARQEGIIIPA